MKVNSNLLPAYVQQRSIALHLGRRWVISWGVIALLIVSVTMIWRREGSPQASNDATYMRVTQESQEIADKVRFLQSAKRDQEKTASLLQGLATTRVPPLILHEMARVAKACDGEIRLAFLTVQQVPISVQDAGLRTRFLVEVEGLAGTDSAVEQFVSLLSNSSVFQNADVKSIEIASAGEQIERRLSITAVVEINHAVTGEMLITSFQGEQP